jgi:serine protease inhibitor ecotin
MNFAEVDMKRFKAVIVVFSLASAAAWAQSSAQPADQTAPPQADQQPSVQKHRFLRDTTPAQQADTCVGPVSYCTLFFGS